MNQAPKLGYEEWFRVRTHEIDQRKRLTVPNLLMMMQEASMQNAMQLNISVWDLEQEEISWVILRKQLKVFQLPELNERIKIVTYPAGFDRVFAYRDFWMTNEKGEVLANAASTWTLMNTRTRKLQRIPQSMLSLSSPVDDQKLPLPDTKILFNEPAESLYPYTIRQFDLDWNNHVNNVVLSKLILQGLPQKMYENCMLKSFAFHIKSECFFEEELSIELMQSSPLSFNHRITGSDQKIVALAQSMWK